jgi:hypothetical protein
MEACGIASSKNAAATGYARLWQVRRSLGSPIHKMDFSAKVVPGIGRKWLKPAPFRGNAGMGGVANPFRVDEAPHPGRLAAIGGRQDVE